jgi:hypothetical protein
MDIDVLVVRSFAPLLKHHFVIAQVHPCRPAANPAGALSRLLPALARKAFVRMLGDWVWEH